MLNNGDNITVIETKTTNLPTRFVSLLAGHRKSAHFKALRLIVKRKTDIQLDKVFEILTR